MSNSMQDGSRPSDSSMPGPASNWQQSALLCPLCPLCPLPPIPQFSNQNTSTAPVRPPPPPPPPPPNLDSNLRLFLPGSEDRIYEDGDLIYYVIADDRNEDDGYPYRRYSTDSEGRYSQRSDSDYLSEEAGFEKPSSYSVPPEHDDGDDLAGNFRALDIDGHEIQLEFEDPNLCIDLNQRFASVRNPPAWYIANPRVLQKGDPAYLCPTCRHIDFNHIFTTNLDVRLESVPEEYILLGFLPEMLQKLDCGFCSLVTAIIKQDCRINEMLTAGEIKEFDQSKSKLWQEYLERRYFFTPFKYPTHYPRGFELFLRSDDDLAKLSQGDLTRAPHSMGMRLIRGGPRGGRLVPSDQIDIGLVKRRLELCEYNTHLPSKQFRHTLRVIDVENLRIVDLEPRGRYMVLSYVWGGAEQVRLTKATIHQFGQPMGLQAPFNSIPQTIKDAIELVSKLKEKYLWVDSLCIIQDDDEDMLAQISQMGDVYGGGVLTISAASGKTAYEGIPGVRPGTRKEWQITRQVGNLTLSNMLGLDEDDDTSPLAGRGWTYQEKVLTQRNVTINYDSIWWQCIHIASPEDEHCWHPQEGQRRHDCGATFFFAGENERAKHRLDNRNNFDTYAFMVSEYTQRQFTKQSDIGNAFIGVSRQLAATFRAPLVFGIPETELDSALLWLPTGKSTRRCEPAPDGSPFPSWSWQGWEGHAIYPWAVEREYSISNKDSPLRFKSATARRFWFDMDEYRTGGHILDPGEWQSTETEWSAWRDRYTSGESFFHPTFHQRYLEYSLLARGSCRLVLYTLSTYFNVGSVVIPRKCNYNVNHKVFRLPILDYRDNMAGYIDIPDPELQPLGIQQFIGRREFIVLSRASIKGHEPDSGPGVERPERKRNDIFNEIRGTRNFVDEKGYFDIHTYHQDVPWCLYNVMMIERVRGVAYRLAIGRTHVEAVA